MPGTRRAATAATLLLACALTVAGCAAGGTTDVNATLPAGSGAPPPATTVATGPDASATPGVDHTDVVAVYRAWWAALEVAYAHGDPADPTLADYAVDPILSAQRASITTLHEQGIVQRTRFTLTPRLRYRTDGNAEVEDCIKGPANTYYDAATGRPRAPHGYRNDAPTEDSLLTTLQRRGDQWYVVAATGKGAPEC